MGFTFSVADALGNTKASQQEYVMVKTFFITNVLVDFLAIEN